MTDAILRKKDFPLHYPTDVLDIIQAMSFSKGKDVSIVGSMSLKSQQYAGDYDMVELVQTEYKTTATAVKYLIKRFQSILRTLQEMKNVYIGDIKAGEIEEWKVIPDTATIKKGKVVGLDMNAVREKISTLKREGVIQAEEAEEVDKLLGGVSKNPGKKDAPPPPKIFLEMKRVLKFQVVRWTPQDVFAGKIELRTGRIYTLQEAFTSPTLTKLDVVGLVQNNRYTDFSIIYQFKNNRTLLNPVATLSDVDAIRMDVLYYMESGNYFKAMKRMFSIARLLKDTTMLKRLNTILNGDLGRLYSVISDIGTLQYLLDNESYLSIERIKYELDQFRSRLSNIYTLTTPNKVFDSLLRLEHLPAKGERPKLESALLELSETLEALLAREAKKLGEEGNILPPPGKYIL